MPATPQISLVQEHCSYIGAYCQSSNFRQESHTSGIPLDTQETNGSKSDLGTSSFLSHTSFQKFTSVSGLIKVSKHYLKFDAKTNALILLCSQYHLFLIFVLLYIHFCIFFNLLYLFSFLLTFLLLHLHIGLMFSLPQIIWDKRHC